MPEELRSGSGEINVSARTKLMEKLKDIESAIESTKKFQTGSAPSDRDADTLMDLLDEETRLKEKIARLSGKGE